MTRANQSKQSSRKTPYRRLYNHFYKLNDNVKRQDECIGYLLNEIRTLQKRMDQMEQQSANPSAPAAVMDDKYLELIRGMGKRPLIP